jgi:hypothetical protein
LDALSRFWSVVPPPAIQLKRIALALGLAKPAPTRAEKPADALKEAMAAGIPVIEGRPDDPMLDLIGL